MAMNRNLGLLYKTSFLPLNFLQLQIFTKLQSNIPALFIENYERETSFNFFSYNILLI